MELTAKAIRFLKAEAHHLKPLVLVGKAGISDALVLDADKLIEARELIKVKFNDHKDDRNELAEQLAEKLNAALVNEIGNIALLYRENKKKKDKLILPS